MSAWEFYEWQAYYYMDPFEGDRDDINAGIIAAQVHNSGINFSGKAKQAVDYIPDYLDNQIQQVFGTSNKYIGNKSIEDQENILLMLNFALGGTVVRDVVVSGGK